MLKRCSKSWSSASERPPFQAQEDRRTLRETATDRTRSRRCDNAQSCGLSNPGVTSRAVPRKQQRRVGHYSKPSRREWYRLRSHAVQRIAEFGGTRAHRANICGEQSTATANNVCADVGIRRRYRVVNINTDTITSLSGVAVTVKTVVQGRQRQPKRRTRISFRSALSAVKACTECS